MAEEPRRVPRRLRPAAAFAALATAGFVAIHLVVVTWGGAPGCAWWLWLIGLASVWYEFVGDWINGRVLDRRIAARERESPDAGSPNGGGDGAARRVQDPGREDGDR